LWVKVPTLEDALVDLLEATDAVTRTDAVTDSIHLEAIGASR
jgi:hypothetical protein